MIAYKHNQHLKELFMQLVNAHTSWIWLVFLITLRVHCYRGMWLHIAWNTCTLRLQLWHFNGSMSLHRWWHCWISSFLMIVRLIVVHKWFRYYFVLFPNLISLKTLFFWHSALLDTRFFSFFSKAVLANFFAWHKPGRHTLTKTKAVFFSLPNWVYFYFLFFCLC